MGIEYVALENGFLPCADPKKLRGDLRLTVTGADRRRVPEWLKRILLPLFLALALTLFQDLLDGFHYGDPRGLGGRPAWCYQRGIRGQSDDLRSAPTTAEVLASDRQKFMLLFDAIWMEITRLFMRLEAECSIRRRQFTVNDAVLPFPLHASLNRVDAQLDNLIYEVFPQVKAS